jgi:hypothetical protein
MSVSVYEVALARDVQVVGGSVNGAEFARVGLPILGGCCVCGATIAAYNAAPSTYGYLMCLNGCVTDETGFPTVEAFEKWAATEEIE